MLCVDEAGVICHGVGHAVYLGRKESFMRHTFSFFHGVQLLSLLQAADEAAEGRAAALVAFEYSGVLQHGLEHLPHLMAQDTGGVFGGKVIAAHKLPRPFGVLRRLLTGA